MLQYSAKGEGSLSQEALEEIMDRWMNDPSFRSTFSADPEGTAAQEGFSLTEDELESLKAMVSEAPGEELEPRISRS
jgi:hypothetical protein